MKSTITAILLSLPLAAGADQFVCSFGTGVTASLNDASWSKYDRTSESSPLMLTFVAMSEAQIRSLARAAKQANDAEGVAVAQRELDRAKATGFSGWVEGADGYTAPVIVIGGNESVTFVETTQAGNVTVTTLFMMKKTIDGKIPAVHSRHMSIVGDGLVSHYTGACIRKTGS